MRPGLVIRLAIALAPVLAPVLATAQGDAGVDDRIREAAAAAESLQGPLDGGWTLAGADGTPIYAFQLVDKPSGDEPLEGVWRDLRHPAAPGDIGLIDALQRAPGALTITFAARPGAPPVTVSLKSDATGAWKGELKEAGLTTLVVMRRS